MRLLDITFFLGKHSVSLSGGTTALAHTMAKPLGPGFCWEMIKSDEVDFVSFIHGEVSMWLCQDEDMALGVIE